MILITRKRVYAFATICRDIDCFTRIDDSFPTLSPGALSLSSY
jgi:hypothetical protein